MSSGLRILVFLGSNRPQRNGERVAKWVVEHLTGRGHSVKLADSKAIGLPLLQSPIHFYGPGAEVPAEVVALDADVAEAEALVVLTAEYNRKMPAAITNLLDHPRPASFAHKPSAIVAYSAGPGGAAVAGMAARQLMVELGAPPVPFLCSVGTVHEALSPDGAPTDAHKDKLQPKMAKLTSQLEWYAHALKAHRDANGPPQ